MDLLTTISRVSEADRPALLEYVTQCHARAGTNGRSMQGFAVAAAASRLERLSQISAPTLILHGRDDRFLLPAHAIAMHERLPHSRLVWLEGGHGFPFAMFSSEREVLLAHLLGAGEQ